MSREFMMLLPVTFRFTEAFNLAKTLDNCSLPKINFPEHDALSFAPSHLRDWLIT